MINMTVKKTKISEKLIDCLLNILIIIFSIVLLISLYTNIQIKILGHNYANFFGYSMFEVQTESMEDEILAGDWIVVKLTNKVKLDDIITYELNGTYITHRVIEVYNSTFITKGDANTGKDDPVDQSQIIGKTVKVLGNIGILRKTLLNPAVLIMLIITLFLFNLAIRKDEPENNILKKIKSYLTIVINKVKSLLTKIPKKEKKTKEVKEVVENKIIEEVKEVPVNNQSVQNPVINDYMTNLQTYEKELREIEKIDDLDQTKIYRVIPVNLSEFNETREEIARNKEIIIDDDILEETEKIEIEAIEDKIEEDSLTAVELELIKNNFSNNKNIIDTIIDIKKEELNELFNIFDDKIETNEATIKKTFINTYINARYYNYYNDKDNECQGKSFIERLEKLIIIVTLELSNNYSGNDSKYSYKVHDYANILRIIANIDQNKNSTESKLKRAFYKIEIMPYFSDWDNSKIEHSIDEIIRIQKSYTEIINYFIKKLETNTFYLTFNQLDSNKNLQIVDLEHNIKFNKIYSDYIIDKTYSEGIVAEDKISVLLTLLSVQIINDMMASYFQKKYIIYIPKSLYKKEKKLARLLRMIDDEYAKAHTMILITHNELASYRNVIRDLKKEGYRFAVAFDEKPVTGRDNLYIINTIFVNKEDSNFENIISYIPEELLENVIYDDVVSKISSIGVSGE